MKPFSVEGIYDILEYGYIELLCNKIFKLKIERGGEDIGVSLFEYRRKY